MPLILKSFASGFHAGFTDCTIALTCWFFRHPIAGILFTITQHSLGFYFLGWYWLLLAVLSSTASFLIIRSK